MKKLASTLPNMVLSLGVITILSAVLLAWVDNVTAGPIALAAQQKKIQAIQSVAPAFDNNPIDDSWEWSPSQSARPYSVYPAFKDGKLVGAAVEAYSLGHLSEELSGISRQALDITALPLGIERVKSQRRLSRTRKSGDYNQLVARYLDVDVLKIVDACALYKNITFSHSKNVLFKFS